jgi:glycosyltransferase involved in cell wall biosynthesis
MHDFAVGLAARGHEVDVMTTDVLDETNRAAPAREVMDGVRVRRFPNLSNDLAWRTKKYLPRGLLSTLARDVGRYDAVHVTDSRTYLTAASFLTSTARRTPLCLSAHGSLPGSSGLRGAVKGVYDAALVRPMLRRAALLLAQTEHEAALYREFGGGDGAVRLLPLPLPPIPGRIASRQGSFRTNLGLATDVRLLLFLGRINRLKGVDTLVEALAPALDSKTVLVLVGRDDGHLAVLQQRFAALFAGGRVRFAGPLYGDDRFVAYADADVFCLTPTHWEETSVAALEAAACGTPVVISEQADIPGLQEAGGGFVVPLREAAIREAVRAALDAGPAMGLRARQHVERQHAADAVVSRLEQYLLEVTGS